MDDHIFAPSVGNRKQNATLALHKCWGDRDARVGGAAPPPLMVMIAAMMRRPWMDSILTEQAAIPPEEFSDAIYAQTLMLRELIANRDVEGCKQLQLVRFEESCAQKYGECVTLFETVLHELRLVALAHNATACFLVVLQRYLKHYRTVRAVEENFREFTMADLVQSAPFVRSVFGDHVQDAVDFALATLFRPEEDDLAPLRAIAADYMHHRRRRISEGGSIAEARSLFQGLSRDLPAVLQRFTSQIAAGALSARSVVSALIALDCGDIAAMIFASVSTHMNVADLQGAARRREVRALMYRHGVENYCLQTSVVLSVALMDAFDDHGQPRVRVAPRSCVASCNVLLKPEAHGWPLEEAGAPAYNSKDVFLSRWQRIARGLLDGWDWRNCAAAGGAVVRALIGSDEDPPEQDVVMGDIDLFFYGLPLPELQQRVQALERHVREKVGVGKYVVLLTSRTMTILIDAAPRLQVALGLWSSLDDVLSTSDIDCCGVGFDGVTLRMTGRAAAAYATRANVASVTHHMVRGSIAFEMRLVKYERRYGFAVLDITHGPEHQDVVRAREFFASARGNPMHRHMGLSLRGALWLMAVDAGVHKAVEPISKIAITPDVSMQDILHQVTTHGFMESDNYGHHEEGYLVVQEDPECGAQMSPATNGLYLATWQTLYNASFALGLKYCDHDMLLTAQTDDHAWTYALPPGW